MNKALVTWAAGKEFFESPYFWSYIGSLKNTSATDIFVFTHDMPDYVREKLSNFTIIDYPKDQIHYLIRDRNLAFTNWIKLVQNDYDVFLFTDSKDVIFQSDPFEYWNPSYEIMVTCEGMKHGDSLWNLADQSVTQMNCKEFQYSAEQHPVINGGIVMGKGICLKYHFFLIWSFSLKSSPATDQGSLNYLYKWLSNGPYYHHTDPRTDCFCLTGEAVKHNLVQTKFENGVYKNMEDKTYCIVHQWDRLNNTNEIIERYSDTHATLRF